MKRVRGCNEKVCVCELHLRTRACVRLICCDRLSRAGKKWPAYCPGLLTQQPEAVRSPSASIIDTLGQVGAAAGRRRAARPLALHLCLWVRVGRCQAGAERSSSWMPAAPPTAVCEEKKGCTEAELPVTVHPHHLEVAAHRGGCWLSAAPAVAASCLHPQPVVPSAPRSSVREPEQVTGCCCSLQALQRAANTLRNLSTAANSARKALRTLTHGRAHGRAVHHQRAVNRGGLSPPPSSIVDSEAGEKGAKKFPSRGAIVY